MIRGGHLVENWLEYILENLLVGLGSGVVVMHSCHRYTVTIADYSSDCLTVSGNRGRLGRPLVLWYGYAVYDHLISATLI